MSDSSCCAGKIHDYESEVVNVERLSEKLFWLTVKCPALAESVRPGHCVMVFAAGGQDPLLGRPFAVADADGGRGEISVCVSIAGRGTKLLSQKQKGDMVQIRGLFGVPLPSDCRVRLISGGVGVAIFLLYNKIFRGNVIDFSLGIPGRGYEKFAAKIKECAPDVKIFTDDGSFGEGNSMFSVLPEQIGGSEAVWACGPLGFFKAADRHFALSRDRLWFSLENRMACGYGGCMGCVVRTRDGLKRVCVDQALFRASEVNLNEH